MAKNTASKSGSILARLRTAVSRDSGSDSTDGAADGTNEPVSERRREQIRRAQKLHRQRKAEYSQRLVAEISDLRAKDAEKTAQVNYLESTVTFLSNLLNEHGIAHQIPQQTRTLSEAQVTVVNDTPNSDFSQHIQVSIPGYAHSLGPATDPTNIQLNLSDPQVGVDFILTLEHPCLYHHHGPANNDDDLLGHSSLMQAPIMARAPPLITPANNTKPYLPPSSSWSVPGEELERLLSFSNQLRLPAEITPVQAWSQLRDRGEAGWTPSKADLDQFLEALRLMVHCYGFGAVIEKAAFEQLLQQHSQKN